MSLLDTVRTWFSSKPSVSDEEQKVRLLLRASIEVVSAYGSVLENGGGNTIPTIKQSEAILPFNKQQILKSITILQQALQQPRLRAILIELLSPFEAQQILSKQFEESLASGLVLLDTFVPTSEAEAEKRQWEETLELMEKIDPEAKKRFLENLAQTQSVSHNKK